ncbi:Ankyrin repeat containing protein [Gracilaria domingensis]|nr:Ankyrin repeat containing protein [Gracilaria domingensis]
MGAQPSKHALILEAVAKSDSRKLREAFLDKSVSPLLLLKPLSAADLNSIFSQSSNVRHSFTRNRAALARSRWLGESPLHYVAEQPDTRILNVIVSLLAGCSEKKVLTPDGEFEIPAEGIFSVRDAEGLSPLSRAVRLQNTRAIRILSKAGANLDEPFSNRKVDKSDNCTWSYLRFAASKGLHLSLKTLLNCSADFEAWGNDGRRPVHLAVEAGHVSCVKLLIEHDFAAARREEAVSNLHSLPTANENEEHGEGNSKDEERKIRAITKYVVRECNYPVPEQSTTGTSVETSGQTIAEDSEQVGGTTEGEVGGAPQEANDPAAEVFRALQSVFRESFRVLSTSRPPARSNRDRGASLLHLACSNDRPKVLKYLLSLDEFKDSIEHMNDSGKTAVFMAIRHHSLPCLDLLVKAGARIHAKDIENWTALHEAVKTSGSRVDIIEYLLDNCDVDINAVDDDGWNPLHVAARFGASEAVDVLIRKGCDLNAQTEDRETAILLASAQSGSTEVLRKLLSYGAKINMNRNTALTPTRLILGRKDFDQLCILLDHLETMDADERQEALDLELPSDAGNTLLHHCVIETSRAHAQVIGAWR